MPEALRQVGTSSSWVDTAHIWTEKRVPRCLEKTKVDRWMCRQLAGCGSIKGQRMPCRSRNLGESAAFYAPGSQPAPPHAEILLSAPSPLPLSAVFPPAPGKQSLSWQGPFPGGGHWDGQGSSPSLGSQLSASHELPGHCGTSCLSPGLLPLAGDAGNHPQVLLQVHLCQLKQQVPVHLVILPREEGAQRHPWGLLWGACGAGSAWRGAGTGNCLYHPERRKPSNPCQPLQAPLLLGARMGRLDNSRGSR